MKKVNEYKKYYAVFQIDERSQILARVKIHM